MGWEKRELHHAMLHAAQFPTLGAYGDLGVHLSAPRLVPIQRTSHGDPDSVRDVEVDHRGAEILVSEQFLHDPHVVAVPEELGREGMSERVTRRRFRDAGPPNGDLDRPLVLGRMTRAPAPSLGLRIGRHPGCGKHELPGQIVAVPWPLSVHRPGEWRPPSAQCPVFGVDRSDASDLIRQVRLERHGHHDDPIHAPFSLPYGDPPQLEIQVLHPKRQRLVESKARPVQKGPHEEDPTLQLPQDGAGLTVTQDRREARSTASAEHVAHRVRIEEVPVQEGKG